MLPQDWTFFGLTPTYKVAKQEHIFDLVYHSKGGFTYNDVYSMPVYLRVFYIKKLEKIFKERNNEHDKAMKQARSRQKKPSKFRK